MRLYRDMKRAQPERFHDNFRWVAAIYAWKKGQKLPLAYELEHNSGKGGANGVTIPFELIPEIQNIIAGFETSDSRGQKSAAIQPFEKMLLIHKLKGKIRLSKHLSKWDGQEALAEVIEEKGGKMPSAKKLHHAYDKLAISYRKQLAKEHNVTVRTIGKWEEEYNEMKKIWPNS